MSDPTTDNAASAAPSPLDNPNTVVVGSNTGVCWLNDGKLRVIARSPLPGIVIFVHGVNSEGEWYKAAEKGLCAGLNDRMKRCAEHMACATPEGGQLTPADYMDELTPDGFINPDRTFKNFMTSDEHFTPVIHFRWGYKAAGLELQKYGEGVYLNEKNYWGGGPFANGCTSLPDLWTEGLSDHLLLWIHIEHLNPTNERIVFSCPPRPYFVLAALRLATLVASIRKKQADVPITIVCHSQGNMIGMAAAFLGDAMPPVKDGINVAGRCVADTYVMCNPPYSLAKSNFTENWSASGKDRNGGTGRQSLAARVGTMRAFLDIVRQPASRLQQTKDINAFMRNENHGFDIDGDRARYGHGLVPTTCGRVTLYCNPHDQVISSTAVDGIGWRGMSQEQIDAVGGRGIFCQRVFAQGYMVGLKGSYHYWSDHYNKPEPGSAQFWVPESLKARYSVPKGKEASRTSTGGQIITAATAPVVIMLLAAAGPRINVLPEENWQIPLDGPNLPVPFKPTAARFGTPTEKFDLDYEARGQWRDIARVQKGAYARDRVIPQKKGEEKREATDAALGDKNSEASMRYEDHARLRMQARREGMATKDAEHVVEEDDPALATPKYTAWQKNKIETYLAQTIDTHATDHSTILANEEHAKKALAYDVAVGLCHISDKDMHTFRIAADWRLLPGLDKDDPNKEFAEYFLSGLFTERTAYEWANDPKSSGWMPPKIVDLREHQPLSRTELERLSRGGHP